MADRVMLTPQQQKRLWEDRFFAEVRAYYFGDLASEYHRRQRQLTYVSLVLSSGAVVGIIAWFAQWAPAITKWAPPLLALAASLVSYYMLTAQLLKKATEAEDLHVRWSTFAKGYERLWEDMYAEDVLKRLNALEDSDPELSRPAIALPYQPKRMARWEDHVQRLLLGTRAA